MGLLHGASLSHCTIQPKSNLSWTCGHHGTTKLNHRARFRLRTLYLHTSIHSRTGAVELAMEAARLLICLSHRLRARVPKSRSRLKNSTTKLTSTHVAVTS